MCYITTVVVVVVVVVGVVVVVVCGSCLSICYRGVAPSLTVTILSKTGTGRVAALPSGNLTVKFQFYRNESLGFLNFQDHKILERLCNKEIYFIWSVN